MIRPGGRFEDWRRPEARFLVADVDGTLIASGREATAGVAAAVAEAHAAGLRVGFATGRLPAGITSLARQLSPDGPHVVHCGAEVVDNDGHPLETWPLTREQRVAFVEWVLRDGLYAEFYVGDEFFVSHRDERARPTWEEISGPPHGLVGDLDLDGAEIIKGTVVAFTPEEAPAVMDGIRAVGLAAEAAPSPLMPGASFVNAVRPDVDKGTGLRFVAAQAGVPLEHVVAVGDGMNDLPLLAAAGTAIAMGQSAPELHEAAHLVVPEVDADGVIHALRGAANGWRDAPAPARAPVPRGCAPVPPGV